MPTHFISHGGVPGPWMKGELNGAYVSLRRYASGPRSALCLSVGLQLRWCEVLARRSPAGKLFSALVDVNPPEPHSGRNSAREWRGIPWHRTTFASGKLVRGGGYTLTMTQVRRPPARRGSDGGRATPTLTAMGQSISARECPDWVSSCQPSMPSSRPGAVSWHQHGNSAPPTLPGQVRAP